MVNGLPTTALKLLILTKTFIYKELIFCQCVFMQFINTKLTFMQIIS